MSTYVDKEPTVERVIELAEAKRSEFAAQDALDLSVLKFLMLKQEGDVAQSAAMEKKDVRPVRTGVLSRQLDRDHALTYSIPTIRFNPRTKKLEDKKHADELLEPWTGGAWQLSQVGDVWREMNRSGLELGRSFGYVSPLPRLWADSSKYKDLIEKLTREKGKDKPDPDKIADILEEIESFKIDNFPIRWKMVPTRGTWPQFSDEYHLPEVVKIRKMKVSQFRTDYGEDKLPESFKESSADTEIEVLDYDNWEWHAVIALGLPDSKGNKDGKFAYGPWQHGLEMNPNVFMEVSRFPENDWGYYWKSSIFSERELSEAFDEFMTDLRHNHRMNTLSGRAIRLNREARAADIQSGGAPPTIKLAPGEDLTLWTDEDVDLIPQPEINAQSFAMANFLKAEIEKASIISAIDEQARSGHSAATYMTELQVAERRFSAVQEAQIVTARQVAQLLLRSVPALSKGFPDAPDTIYVVGGRGTDDEAIGQIGLAPKDIQGWLSPAIIQPRIETSLITTENIKMAMAADAAALGLPPDFWLPRYLNVENVQHWVDRIDEYKLQQGLLEDLLAEIRRRVQIGLSQLTEQELAELQGNLGQMPPDLAGILSQFTSNGQLPPPQNQQPLQGLANTGRTGVPQAPENQMMIPAGV